ncbi:DUF1963 domain-containing protein [Luteimonas sp. Y-2-2-4F]|nr:DUF1963 domain-containing protein [Luteimonas sp. Y-2-2-4F]MCD9033483.1 DUF1963 domain-containing protein [Luteimonas sp. Y-2-2-4F]
MRREREAAVPHAAAAALVLALAGCGERGAPKPAAEAPAAAGDAAAGPAAENVAAAAEAFLAPYRDRLEATRRPAMRIALEPLPDDALAASKVGGRAWWPAGEPPPRGADGRPLALLAQIAFAELPEPLPGYPRDGLLQFFVADDDLYGAVFDGGAPETVQTEQRGFRVAYWPDLEREATGLPIVASDRLPHDPRAPRRMRFVRADETMRSGDYRFQALFGGDFHAAIEAFAVARGLDADLLAEALHERLGGQGHKLGGYPFFTQADPRSGGERELLLQLDSDDAMMWGDSGVGHFFVAPGDLARADFGGVLYNWDCL